MVNDLTKSISESKTDLDKDQVINSVDDLVCSQHPEGVFEVIGIIPGSFIFSGKMRRELNIYQCKSCQEDSDVDSKSTAYDCPKCGVVTGEITKTISRSSFPFTADFAGREGENYSCHICGSQLGYYYWKKYYRKNY